MFTHLLTLLVLVATAECQGAWDARAQRHSPQGFSLTGIHQHKVHASHDTAAQSTPPPRQFIGYSAISSHIDAKETAQQHTSSNNAVLQGKKTETVNNFKTPYSSIPSHDTKHDAGWAAVQKGEVPYHTQPSERISKNVKRLLHHTKNSVSIVDHIWKMFQISPLKQTRTQEATHPGSAQAQGFRVKSRLAIQPDNLVQKIGKNHNHHNHHQGIHDNNNHQNTNHLQSSNHINNINNHHQYNTHMSNNQNHNQHNNQHNIPNNNYNNQNNNNHHTNNIYNLPRNNTGETGKFQGNVINPIKNVLKRVLSPYDKIQTGLESIKSEVGVQQGMLGQLQSSMDKMKEIFFSIQTDMKNVLSSINSIMKMQ